MKKQYLITIAALVLLTATAKIIVAATLASSPLQPSVFIDSSSNVSLSIQLVSLRPDTGRFVFTVPGIGNYRGTIPLQQSGQQIVHPQGTIAGQLTPFSGGVPTNVSIKMEGEINTVQNNANINIMIDKTKYHLQTAVPDPAAAATVSNQILTNTISKNWSNVYTTFSPEIQTSISPSQFAQTMASSPYAHIISANPDGAGQIKTVAGNSYYIQPITITVQQPDGSTATLHSTEFLVLINGAWKLLSTTSPKP